MKEQLENRQGEEKKMIDRKTGYTTLLLDMDGTFLDFEAAEKSAFMTAMTRHGYPAGEREYAVYGEINCGLWEAFERGEIDKPTLLSTRFGRLFDALGIKGDGAAFEREYQALLGEGAQLVEGAEEVLSYLAENYALYVVTNGVERTQRNRQPLRAEGAAVGAVRLRLRLQIGKKQPGNGGKPGCFSMRRKNAGGKPFVPDGMNLGPGILKKASGGGGNDSHAKPAVRKPGGGTGVVIETEAGECQSVLGGSLRKRLLPAAVQDEGKPGKLGQTDAVRKAVRLRKVTRVPCRQQRFSSDREGNQIFSLKRGADDGKLQQVRMKLFQELVGVGFKQLKADGGILFMKALHPFRKQAAAHRGDDAEAERSRHAVPAVDELLSGHIRQL